MEISCYITSQTLGRFSHTSHMINEKTIILIGGLLDRAEVSSNSSGQTMGIINLETKQYEERHISIHPQSSNGQPLLFNHTTYVDTKNKQLYILGGGSNCFSFGMHVNYSVIKIPLYPWYSDNLSAWYDIK